MAISHISNQNIFSIDWAYAERQAAIGSAGRQFLKKLQGQQRVRVWMIDSSASDKRSVKAQLKGHRSSRVLWWNVFSAVHRAFFRSASLEQTMFDFHRLHHFFTISMLEAVEEHRLLASAIRREGLCRAVQRHVADFLSSFNQHKR
jgi:hypothetical protein